MGGECWTGFRLQGLVQLLFFVSWLSAVIHLRARRRKRAAVRLIVFIFFSHFSVFKAPVLDDAI
jgi:hypothetical protein